MTMTEPPVLCDGDSCDVTQLIQKEQERQEMDRAAVLRVERWGKKLRLDPIDYDMPGSSAREQGV